MLFTRFDSIFTRDENSGPFAIRLLGRWPQLAGEVIFPLFFTSLALQGYYLLNSSITGLFNTKRLRVNPLRDFNHACMHDFYRFLGNIIIFYCLPPNFKLTL